MEDDIFNKLNFRRFGKERQEQIRQLVTYAALLGLSGKDLISVGGVLDRESSRQEYKRRLAIVKSFDTVATRKDYKARLYDEFVLTHENKKWLCSKVKGTNDAWHIQPYEVDSTGAVIPAAKKNKKGQLAYPIAYRVNIYDHQWGARKKEYKAYATLLMDIHNGHIKLK